jgi:hypothetical protein
MVTTNCTTLVNITIGTVFYCILAILVSCSGDQQIPDASKGISGTAETADKAPPPVVKQWYPAPVHTPQQTVLVPVITHQAQQAIPMQPAPGSYYQPVPVQQPQVVMQPGYNYPQQPVYNYQQQPQQIPQAVVPWGQSVQSQPQGSPQTYQYQVVPQYQTMPRPWGEIDYGEKKKQSTAPSQQQTVVVPYGTWPGAGTAMPGWGGGVPYGTYPGLGYPGHIW